MTPTWAIPGLFIFQKIKNLVFSLTNCELIKDKMLLEEYLKRKTNVKKIDNILQSVKLQRGALP